MGVLDDVGMTRTENMFRKSSSYLFCCQISILKIAWPFSAISADVQALPSSRLDRDQGSRRFWITTKSKYSQALTCCKLVHFWMFLVQTKYVCSFVVFYQGFQCLTLRANILANMLVFYLHSTLQMRRLNDSAGHD